MQSEINNVPVLTIKASYKEQLRRFSISQTMSWEALRSQICELFGVSPEHLVAKYLDDETDLVNIDTNAELQEAFKITKPQQKLTLVLTSSLQEETSEPLHYRTNTGGCKRKRHCIPEEQLLILEQHGFKNRRLNTRFMKRFYYDNTDLAVVIEHLKKQENKFLERQEKKKQRCSERENKRRCRREGNNEKKAQRKNSRREERNHTQDTNMNEDSDTTNILAVNLVEDLSSFAWEELSSFYLDGNNMLYLCSTLRNLTLSRKVRQAEELLTSIANAFGIIKNIPSVVMIYDHGKNNASEITHENGTVFKLCNARPAMKTSDDQLVAWAQEDPENAQRSLVLTSDRELTHRLQTAGCKVSKPKNWLNYAANVLGKTEDQSLDDWLKLYQAKVVEKDSAEESMDILN